ncbi:MAG: hypothetical protein WCZ66_03815 [Sphingomonadaceae bacterium]
MEQLGGQAIRALLDRLQIDPWGAHPVTPPGAAILPEDCATDRSAAPLIGVERRLVRRAEILWNQLRGDALMPGVGDAAPLLAPPFLAQSVLMVFPSAEAASLATTSLPVRAEILYVGEAVRALDMVKTGQVTADAKSSAGLSARFAALAAEAVRAGTIARCDSDSAPPATGTGTPPLLMRGVALPLSAADGNSAVIMIASWRRLLSVSETAALHRELAEAFDWMARHGND